MTKRKIVLTGTAGLLGSHLVEHLLRRGYSVIGVDSLRLGNKRNVERLLADQNFTFEEKDILSKADMLRLCNGAESILHLAAEKIPRYSSSLNTLEVNVKGTENLLDAAKETGARFIFASSDEIYGKNQDLPLLEESMLVYGLSHTNRWSLGVSKMFGEHLCFAYREKYGLPITIIRYSGGYGPTYTASWANSPVNIFIDSALRGESIPIHGDGTQTRSFTYIDDLVEGTMKILESSYVDGEILNLGSDNSISMVNLAYLVWREIGGTGKPNLRFVPYTDFSNLYEDVRHRKVDCSKAHYLLGYHPKVSLEEGVHLLAQWYKAERK